jgi:quinol monooxygenase YgiN
MAKISMFVKLTAKPGSRDDLVKAFVDSLPLVEEEPGTEVYGFHTDAADENVLWVHEIYTDQAALDAHFTGAALAQIMGSIGELLDGAPEMHTTAVVAGKGVPA